MIALKHRLSLMDNKFHGGMIIMETCNSFGLENIPVATRVIAAYMALALVNQPKNVIVTQNCQSCNPIKVSWLYR
jgi:hypothetical protein